MNLPEISNVSTRSARKKILFVWDGTSQQLWCADNNLNHHSDATILVVHAMPHESIYSYGTLKPNAENATYVERKLRDRFRAIARRTKVFRGVKLELLFGDRVSEIIRFAESMQVQSIVMTSFKQSGFSRWIHGNLNERLEQRAPCPITFLQKADQRTAKGVEHS